MRTPVSAVTVVDRAIFSKREGRGPPSLPSAHFRPMHGERTLITILVAAFLVLHVLAGAILQDAAPIGSAPMQGEWRATSYD